MLIVIKVWFLVGFRVLPLALRPRALRCPCEGNEDERPQQKSGRKKLSGVAVQTILTWGRLYWKHDRWVTWKITMLFLSTFQTHASHYSPRKTDTAPSKRERATSTHHKLVFKYILHYMWVYILKLCMLWAAPSGQNENVNRLNCVSKHAVSAAR